MSSSRSRIRLIPRGLAAPCRWACGTAVLLALAALVGCSPSRTAEVSGTVTYRGKPVPAAIVTFIGGNTPAASCGTDTEGRYSLTVSCPAGGSANDRRAITVTPLIRMTADGFTPDPATPLVRLDIPGRYQAHTSTPLSAEIVVGRANVVDLNLEDH